MKKSREQLLDELQSCQAQVRALYAENAALLDQGEQRYRMLFNEMLDGFALHEIICDEQGRPCDYRFLDVNPAFERLTGLARADLLGKTVLEVLPNTEPFWIEMYGSVALGRLHRQFENYSGALGKTYEVTAFSPQRGQFAVIFEDISARKQAEAALRESEEKFRAVLEQFSDGFMLIGEQGRIEEWNQALEQLTGLPHEQTIGQFAWVVQWSLMPPEQRALLTLEHVEKMMRDLLASGQLQDENQTRDVIFKVADGQVKIARQAITVVKTSKGVKVGTLLHDITLQKAAEAALQESEERYRRLVEFSPDAIAVHSGGKLVYVNAAGVKMVGAASAKDLLNKSMMELVHPASREMAAERARMVLRDGVASQRVEEKFLRLDGSSLDVEVTSLPFTYQGQPAAQVIVHDITAHKQVELVQTFLAQHGWLSQGEDFFNALARYLAVNLEMDYVCIDRLEGDGLSARTLAIYSDGQFEDNISYALKDTPCAMVPGKTICVFEEGVRHLFPHDQALQDLCAESYLGTTLWDSTGQPIGLIAVIGRRPLKDFGLAESVLRLVSGRAGGELERRLAEEALRESEERYRQLVELSPSAVFVECQGRMVFVNEACLRLFGAQHASQIVGKVSMDFVAPEYLALVQERIRLLELGGDNPPLEQKFLRLDGTVFDVQVSAASLTYRGKPATQVIALDISERKQAEQKLRQAHTALQEHVIRIESLRDQLREQATRDYLTGLFNRRYLQDTLERELSRAAREQQPVSLVMMDVDHFKLVNDTYGHRAGDLMLETWGEVLKSNTRRQDIACRYGGEEFVIVMPGAGLEAARERAEWLCKYCADQRLSFEGNQLQMTMSFGVAAYPQHAMDEDALLIRADRALYRAKRAGRNRVYVYHDV